MLIVFNPTAGTARRRRLARVLEALRASGRRPELAETTHPGHAGALARDAARRGVGVVVAAGGDGTIAEVAGGLAGSDSALGVVPLGTANVLAWELGVPRGALGAAAALAGGRTVALRPGVARFADGRSRLFVQMLGAGFDAAVVAGLDLGLKRRIGRGAYVWQTLRELPRHGFPPIRVEADGRVLAAASVVVSKGRLYAGRYELAPGMGPDRPGFRVVRFTRGGAAAALLYGAALPLGLLPRLPGVEQVAARRVVLSAADPEGALVPVQADGDPAGHLPVEIVEAEAPIRILLP